MTKVSLKPIIFLALLTQCTQYKGKFGNRKTNSTFGGLIALHIAFRKVIFDLLGSQHGSGYKVKGGQQQEFRYRVVVEGSKQNN